MRVGKYVYSKHNLVLYINPGFVASGQNGSPPHFSAPTSSKMDEFLDISYEQLSQLTNQGMQADTIYVCDMTGRSCYGPLEYIELSQSLDTIRVSVEVNFRMSEWKAQMSLLSFVGSLRKGVQQSCGISSRQEKLFDEDLLHIKFKLLASYQQDIASIMQRFSRKLQKLHRDILVKYAEDRLSLSALQHRS